MTPPNSVRRTLRALWQDIRDAHNRRSPPTKTVATRAFTFRKILQCIEEGDHGISCGKCASVLNALGLLDGLSNLADPASDEVGMKLASRNLLIAESYLSRGALIVSTNSEHLFYPLGRCYRLKNGDRASYPAIVDKLSKYGTGTKAGPLERLEVFERLLPINLEPDAINAALIVK